jgi:hypothetical protein
MDDSCVSRIAGVLTMLFIIAFVISRIYVGVQNAANEATHFLENLWSQLGQVVQQVVNFLQGLFGSIKLPDTNPPSNNETPTAKVTTEPLSCGGVAIGEQAVVGNTEGHGLLCKVEPGVKATVLAGLADGTEVKVLDGPQPKNGYDWWKVEPPGQTPCWAAGEWLCPLAAISITGKVTGGHGIPLVGVVVSLMRDRQMPLEKIATTTSTEEGIYTFKNIPSNVTYRIEVVLKDKDDRKRVVYGNEELPVTVQTQPIIPTPGSTTIKDIDFADNSLIADPRIKGRLTDLTAMYFHTWQVEDFARNSLKFNKYRPPLKIRGFWQPGQGCDDFGSKYGWQNQGQGEITQITITESMSSWEHRNRPIAREWHENFHHLSYVAMPATLRTIRSDYEEWTDESCKKVSQDKNGDGEINFVNHGGFKNWYSGDSWLEGWAEFWSCALAQRTTQSQGPCRYELWGSEYNLEDNWKVWDHTSSGRLFGKCVPGLACNEQEQEELAVASLLWDLNDPKDTSDQDNVDLSLDSIWQIIGTPSINNDLSDMRDVCLAQRIE